MRWAKKYRPEIGDLIVLKEYDYTKSSTVMRDLVGVFLSSSCTEYTKEGAIMKAIDVPEPLEIVWKIYMLNSTKNPITYYTEKTVYSLLRRDIALLIKAEEEGCD